MILVHRLRTFFYSSNIFQIACLVSFRSDQIDRMHDHNTEKFIECIKTSHDICGVNNLIAIKVTALVRPSVLKKFNTLLKSVKARSSLPALFELINQEQTNEKTVSLLEQSVNSSFVKDQVGKG